MQPFFRLHFFLASACNTHKVMHVAAKAKRKKLKKSHACDRKKKAASKKKMQRKKKKKARHTQNASENKKHAWTFQLFSFLSERKPKRKKRPCIWVRFLCSLFRTFSARKKAGKKKHAKCKREKKKKKRRDFSSFFSFLSKRKPTRKKNDPCYVSFCLSLFRTLFFFRSLFFFSLCCIFVARFLSLSLCTHGFFFSLVAFRFSLQHASVQNRHPVCTSLTEAKKKATSKKKAKRMREKKKKAKCF
jgi:hypothetical protein